ncbi:WD40-repeat-containing domain protein [Boletus reticuloceps]|uniref:WD40-repeat-containing domain protein n=1 Tax=Boletus reticuloceps TaxID=495285 RepID=A0A8I2YYY4_9AGAM|nr:WD40-repeat-containing domain protein [Boletus reticuloceps]
MELQPYHHLVIARDETAIDALAFFPDAERLVTGYHDGTIGIWNMQNGKEERTLMGHEGAAIGSLVVTSDGRTLVSSDENGRTRVWNIASQTLVKEWTLPSGLSEVAISPDNRFVAIGNRKLDIYPLDGGQGINTSIKFRGKLGVTEIRYSPDGDKLACVIAFQLYVFDVRRGKQHFWSTEDGRTAWDVLWSLDSRKLFSTWSDRAIHCFNSDTGEPIGQPWMGRAMYSKFLFLSSDGSKLVTRTAGTDRRIALFASGMWLLASPCKLLNKMIMELRFVLHPENSWHQERTGIYVYRGYLGHIPSGAFDTWQIGQAFHDHSPPPPFKLGRLSAQTKESEDLRSASDVLSQPGESGDLSSHPSSTCDQCQYKCLPQNLF